jgi:hypothetical protein
VTRMIRGHNGGTKRPLTVRVMHVIDTLVVGGAERVAVNLANLLPRARYEAHLCTTRSEGMLAHLIAHDVGRLRLWRGWRYDITALLRALLSRCGCSCSSR